MLTDKVGGYGLMLFDTEWIIWLLKICGISWMCFKYLLVLQGCLFYMDMIRGHMNTESKRRKAMSAAV